AVVQVGELGDELLQPLDSGGLAFHPELRARVALGEVRALARLNAELVDHVGTVTAPGGAGRERHTVRAEPRPNRWTSTSSATRSPTSATPRAGPTTPSAR